MQVDINLTEVLIAVITAIAGYFGGYRRGRKVYRSGDFIVVKKSHPAEPLE